MKEIDQFVGLHRAGEINDPQLVKAVLDLFEEYQHARQIGIDVPPLEPWVKKLQSELEDAKSAWYAEQNRLKMPAGMTWGSGRPSIAAAVGPGCSSVVFGVITVAAVASGTLGMPNGWQMILVPAVMCVLGFVFCIWFVVKAGLYERGQRDYDVKRTRIILRNCQSRYEPG